MLYELFSLRVIQVGVAFFLLFVGGSLLYSWHVHHTTDVHLAETQRSVEVLEKHHPTHTGSDGSVLLETEINKGISEKSASDEPEMMSSETEVLPGSDAEILDFIDAFFADESHVWDAEESEESVDAPYGFSPYGFGAFPEVPMDYPRTADEVWGEARLATMRPEHELLSRVQIKLWTQGVRTFGSVYNTDYDLIFPVRDDVVYIQRDSSSFISSMLGSPATINRYEDDLFEGNFPPHLTIYEYPDGGIDPYDFLDISR